jgi:hypothetical protein
MALYGTIWIALTLFVLAEVLKAHGTGRCAWAWRLSIAGVALCAVHMGVALASRYAWDHAAAAADTARQAAAVYGAAWGGAIYVNYVFLGTWLADACWSSAGRRSGRIASLLTRWPLRAFYLLIVFNAAVVFARAPARIAGLVLVGVLIWAWWPRATANRSAPSPVS